MMNDAGRGFGSWWQGLPLGTRAVISINAVVYVVGLCVPQNWWISAKQAPGHFCIFPKLIWGSPAQAYRIITSAFVHGGLMHIGFNMLNFNASGPGLERQLGSLKFVNLIFTLVLALGFLYVAIAIGCAVLFSYGRFFNECAVGFSGVLFAIITTESLTVSADRVYNFWGNRIPARWYPWAMLIFSQLLMPNVSFIGHLVGILGAFLYVSGYLDPVLLPEGVIEWFEECSFLAFVVEHPRYVKSIRSTPTASSNSLHWSSWWTRIVRRIWPERRGRSSPEPQSSDIESGHPVEATRFRELHNWVNGSGGGYTPVPLAPDVSVEHSGNENHTGDANLQITAANHASSMSEQELRAKAASAALGRSMANQGKTSKDGRLCHLPNISAVSITSSTGEGPGKSSPVVPVVPGKDAVRPPAVGTNGQTSDGVTNWIPIQERPVAAYSFGQSDVTRAALRPGDPIQNHSDPKCMNFQSQAISELVSMGFEEEESRQVLQSYAPTFHQFVQFSLAPFSSMLSWNSLSPGKRLITSDRCWKFVKEMLVKQL